MFYIIYVSSAVRPFTDAELLALLHQSQKNNSERGITGILLYRDGNFIQVLEGPEETVRERVNKIERDPRHTGFITMLQGHTETRFFPEWTMGFVPNTQLTAEDDAAINTFLRPLPGEILDLPITGLHPALKLLLSFKKYMR